MKILTIGKCCLCPKQIYKTKPPSINISKNGISITFKRLPYALNDDGTFVWLLLSDGSRMNVSICKTCLEKLTDEQVKKIHADIVYTKLEQIKKDKRGDDIKYRLFDAVRTIEIWRWSKSEQELVDYLNGRKNDNLVKSERSS